MSRPTEAAYDAAMQILHGPFAFFSNDLPKPTAIEVALVIDKHTQLPEKNAALLLAQTIIDSLDGNAPDSGMYVVDVDLLDNLREALTRIKKTTDSTRGQKDYGKESADQPPQAGQIPQDPPA